MKPRQNSHRSLLVGLVALIGATASTAVAQDDIRDENQRLTARIAELEKAVDDRDARIAELLRRVASLERLVASGSATTPAPVEETSIDESSADASPRALLAALRTSYTEAMKDLEIGDNDRVRRAYMRAVERWKARVNREFTTQIKWHVRLQESEMTPRGPVALAMAVDPVTGVELGDHFHVSIPRAQVRRIEILLERSGEVLVLRGVLRPNVQLNADRQSTGPFDSPRLIGPFADFHFSVDADSFAAPDDPDEDEETKEEKGS